MNRWILLDDDALPGAENMARDEYLLSRAESGGGAPALRLYSFSPPALTVGFHQDPFRVLDIDAVRADGVDVVRRITGGRALLHAGELTYCVTAPLDDPALGGGLQETFLGISGAIVDALRLLGVEAELASGRSYGRERGTASPCLVSASRHEIAVRGRKIVGSAQRRTRRALLQHGSILLDGDSTRIGRYLGGSWSNLEDQVTSISEETGAPADAARLRQELVAAFGARFGVDWRPLVLGEREIEEIAHLAAAKRN
ncbi:MAG: lipoate--protein ligase family protein, partial [Candidatus Krumholzibacteriota bacterium]|nr:lipoate--protein ligase family protein [Candidatus Krumholzibacteriota bacterium]